MLKSFTKISRPYVVFDPANAEHRLHYKNFMLTNGWKGCPFQWLIDDSSIDIVHSINHKLIQYYVSTDTKLSTTPAVRKVTTSKRKIK